MRRLHKINKAQLKKHKRQDSCQRPLFINAELLEWHSNLRVNSHSATLIGFKININQYKGLIKIRVTDAQYINKLGSNHIIGKKASVDPTNGKILIWKKAPKDIANPDPQHHIYGQRPEVMY